MCYTTVLVDVVVRTRFMALTSLHWQQPYARLQISKANMAPTAIQNVSPRFSGAENFAAPDQALETALKTGGHTPEWFSTQLGGKLWRMIAQAGRLFLYVSPHDAQDAMLPKPDGSVQEAAKAQLSKTLAPLGTVELRMASADNCCRGRCRGCVETVHSSHHDTWSLPVIPNPISATGTTGAETRQDT
jgi:hypothetical protein